MPAGLVPSVRSLAATVAVPTVFKVTLKVWVPPASAALAGNTALVSEDVIPTVSLTLVVRYEFASTAFTVTLKGMPAVCAVGVPVLPLGVPGAEPSPGASNNSLAICALVTAKTLLNPLVKPGELAVSWAFVLAAAICKLV